MKKLLSLALCLCMVIAVGCMATGCGNDEVLKKMDELQTALQTQSGKIDELQAQNSQLTEKLEEMQLVIDEQAKAIEELNYKTTQGVFYTVSEAYKRGFISLEDVKSIAYYHHGDRIFNEDIMPEDYKPILKTPEVLTENMQRAIRKTCWVYHYAKYSNSTANYKYTPDDFMVDEYAGTYNCCVAIMASGGNIGYATMAWKEEIDGVVISYADANRLYIWREI